MEGKKAKIGVTFHAQTELGDVVYVDIVSKFGTSSFGGQCPSGTIEGGQRLFQILIIPTLQGLSVSVNEELEAHPELVNSDPYGSGWIR